MKKLAAILALSGALAFPVATIAQEDPEWLDYTDGMVNDFLSEDEVVVLSYYTEWCNTCETQENLIDRMRRDNPAYEQMKYVRVNLDEFEKRPIVRNFDVFGRSTIIVVRQGGEVANIFADTSRTVLQEALDAGLAAIGTE